MFKPLLVLSVLLSSVHGFELDKKRYMDIPDIKEGMKGYGKTVFKGTKIERFKVEVVSVLRKIRPRRNLILVRATHPILKTSGIIAGMSGSPVYIKDRMIGAIGYTWKFAEEALGGVTPIGEMLELVRESEDKDVARSRPSQAELFVDLSRFTSSLPSAEGRRWRSILSEAQVMQTIRTPISLTGFPDFARKRLQGHFASDNLLFVPGGEIGPGDAKNKAVKNAKLEPGAVIGVQLIRGDAQASGIGTVTEGVGDKVLAFGHPMFGFGSVELPMTVGYVHGVMPSQVMSFKFGSSIKVMGTIRSDEEPGIMGKLGPPPVMIPVEVEVDWSYNGRKDRFQYEVLDHPFFTAQLADSVIASSLLNRSNLPQETTLGIETELLFRNHEPIRLGNVFSAPNPRQSVSGALNLVFRTVHVLLNNDFGEFEIKKISTKFHVVQERRYAAVVAVRPRRNEVAPGESLEVVAEIYPYQKGPQPMTFKLEIPQNAPEGIAQLYVVDPTIRLYYERRERPNRLRAQSVEQFLEVVTRREDLRNLYLRLVLSGGGLAVKGVELPSLPNSILVALRPPSATGTNLVREVIESRHQTPWIIKSHHRLPITIRRK